jgi:phage-related holin
MKKESFYYIVASSFGGFCSFIGIEPIVVLILMLSYSIDLISGILRSKVTGEYESKIGWIKTLVKVLGMGLVGVVALIFKVLNFNHELFLMSSLMVLAMHDLISASSNLYTIKTGKELQELDAFSLLIKKINNTLISVVKKILNVEDERQDNDRQD